MNDTVEVSLSLPAKLINKIKVIRSLAGHNSGSIEPMLVDLLDQAVNQKILQELGITVAPSSGYVAQETAKPVRRAAPAQPAPQDQTGIAEGLGDQLPPEEVEDEQVQYAKTYEADGTVATTRKQTKAATPQKKRVQVPQPKNVQGGLSEQQLDQDLAVSNPDVEAAAEATEVSVEVDKVQAPEDTFASMLSGEDVNARTTGQRRQRGAGKGGKVREMAHNESVDAP